MERDRFDHSVDHSDVSKRGRLRRIEVITGIERRRRWAAEEKLAIVAESMIEGAVVSEVARRHGISPQQLFGWRSKVKAELSASRTIEAPAFVPAVVDLPVLETASAVPAWPPERAGAPTDAPWAMEIAIGAVTVRVRGGTDTGLLSTVLKAFRVRP
jgi:transposase